MNFGFCLSFCLSLFLSLPLNLSIILSICVSLSLSLALSLSLSCLVSLANCVLKINSFPSGSWGLIKRAHRSHPSICSFIAEDGLRHLDRCPKHIPSSALYLDHGCEKACSLCVRRHCMLELLVNDFADCSSSLAVSGSGSVVPSVFDWKRRATLAGRAQPPFLL